MKKDGVKRESSAVNTTKNDKDDDEEEDEDEEGWATKMQTPGNKS